ncbi:MAG: caspase family protein, partial [Myxococcales bacterium]|nr:caspase family protein [Myxococcales bacterium]
METDLFALHIGVGTYAGTTARDLPGAPHDARRWQRYTTGAHTLGLPAEQVRLLLDDEATKAGIEAGLAWLAEAMQHGAAGIVTFSGHGSALGDISDPRNGLASTLALCPHDTNIDDPGSVITLAALEKALGDAASRVTVFVDACYTRGLRCLPVGGAEGLTHVDGPSRTRTVLGVAPWQEAWEVRIDSRWQGAFSHSILTLLEQWTIVRRGPQVWANVSHGDLVFATQSMLRTLGLAQDPTMLGPPKLSIVPVFQPGMAVADGATSQEPDGNRRGSQLGFGNNPNYRVVELYAVDGENGNIPLATVYITGKEFSTKIPAPWGGGDLVPETEYWFCGTVDTSDLSGMTGYELLLSQIDVEYESDDWPSSAPTFSHGCNVTASKISEWSSSALSNP